MSLINYKAFDWSHDPEAVPQNRERKLNRKIQ